MVIFTKEKIDFISSKDIWLMQLTIAQPSFRKKVNYHILFPLPWKIHVISKSHVHINNQKKTAAKFKKDTGKIVGRHAFTKYPESTCIGFGRNRAKID